MDIQNLPIKPTIDKKNILILFLVISNLFLVSFLFLKKPATNQTNPDGLLSILTNTPTPEISDPTQNWQTYTNEEYGFEFKYPKYFIPQECAIGLTTRSESLMCLNEEKSNNQRLTSLADFRIRAINTSSNKKIQELLINDVTFDGSGLHPNSFDSFKKQKIGDNEFYFIETGLFEGILNANYYYIGKNYILVFELSDSPVDLTNPDFNSDKSNLNNTARQILSTFKFTNPTSTIPSGWQTYKNEKYGFEFKYPNEFVYKPYSGNIDDDKGDNIQSINFNYKELELGREIVSGIRYTISVNKEKCDEQGFQHPSVKDLRDITVGSIPAKFYHFSWDGREAETIQIPINGGCVYISASYGLDYKDLWENQFNQILSTFKFTTSIPTIPSDWQTYNDHNIGLSFQYPAEWTVGQESNLVYIRSKETSDKLLDKNNTWTRVGDIIITKMPISKLPNNTNNLSLEDWVNSQEAKNYGISQPIQMYSLNGLTGYKVMGCGEMCTEEIYLDISGIVYSIESGNSEYFSETSNQIISTLKFTN